jgi:hypothetical protein
LWRGEPVSYAGKHYHVNGLTLAPMPVQEPRIPIWIGGDWLVPGVRRRLTRWDGCCVYVGTPGSAEDRPIEADDIRGILALVARERGTTEGYTVCVGGSRPDPDRERQRAHIRSLAEAGATWWNDWIPPCDLVETREIIRRGPLRID